MARLPRLYRVTATFPDTSTKVRHYQTPEAAEERRLRFVDDGAAAVEVVPSHPIQYPAIFGDSAQFEIPDSLISRTGWAAVCERLGVKPEALLSVRTAADPDPMLVVEYETDLAHPGRRAPGIWRIHIETEG